MLKLFGKSAVLVGLVVATAWMQEEPEATMEMPVTPDPPVEQAPMGMVSPDDQPDALVTLWAKDDRRNTFSLSTGGYASDVVEGELKLDDAHLAYGVFEAGRVTLGFGRDSRVAVIDLGERAIEGQPDPGDRSPAVPLNAFNTMRLHRGRLITEGPRKRRTFIPEADALVSELPNEGIRSFAPEVGHIYLIRVLPRGFKEREDLLAILEPVDVEFDRRMTFRWARLR